MGWGHGSMEDLVVRNFLAPNGANWRQIGANWRQITPMNMRFFMFFRKLAPIGAKSWRLRTTAKLAPFWRYFGAKLGKRVMTLSDQFLAPIFDFLAPKTIIGAKYYRQ